MYQWRKLTAGQRQELLASRKQRKLPWHSPPHWKQESPARFHLSASCYEHAPIIGLSPSRMVLFADELLAACPAQHAQVFAWCLLPNHYHLLVETSDLAGLVQSLGRLHGRNSHAWNIADHSIGRKIFHRTADRHIRSDGHFWATLNYVHHNPVHHGYVTKWTEWPWSSAGDYLDAVGRDEAADIWKAYPVLDYGEGWDDPKM